jgi:hypothetical protein
MSSTVPRAAVERVMMVRVSDEQDQRRQACMGKKRLKVSRYKVRRYADALVRIYSGT